MILDWGDDALIKVGELLYRYSGVISISDPVPILHSNYMLSRRARQFTDTSLTKYASSANACSTSWATAIIEIAEVAIGNSVELSIDQLLHCLPDYLDIDGCQGVLPTQVSVYLAEIGLMRKKNFTTCKAIRTSDTYHFSLSEPEVPNASGVMNLVSEGVPVFALMALDILKLRFITNLGDKDVLRAGGYQPSLYGIIGGYSYDKDMMDSSFWEIVTHIIPQEELVFRIPMSSNMTNGNYAGISAFTFTLIPSSIPMSSSNLLHLTIKRVTGSRASEERAILYRGSSITGEVVRVFSLPKDSSSKTYSIVLSKEVYTLELTDSGGDGWDIDSYIEFLIGEQSIGEYSAEEASSAFTIDLTDKNTQN